ncbi:MAG: hypothetical protein ACXACF_01650 [Candidatus Hermodarchaeia archaeon]|jgi:hypothetical protein
MGDTRKYDSLAGTDQVYNEARIAKGLRVRTMEGGKLRIHVKKDAPDIDSRERDKYWAIDVPAKAIFQLASKLANGE